VPTRLMADFRQVKDACLAALSQPAPASDSGR